MSLRLNHFTAGLTGMVLGSLLTTGCLAPWHAAESSKEAQDHAALVRRIGQTRSTQGSAAAATTGDGCADAAVRNDIYSLIPQGTPLTRDQELGRTDNDLINALCHMSNQETRSSVTQAADVP